MSATVCVTVPLEEVEREVSRQMKALQETGEEPIRRVRMSNLVIFCSGNDQVDDIVAKLPAVVAVHPARALLVIGETGGPGRNVTASVHVQPQRLGAKQQSCTEQIILYASGHAVDRLPFAVRALLIGDLPTNLWWAAPQPPPLAGPLLVELAEQAQQIIYDSLGWREPARGVAAVGRWLEEVDDDRRGGRWRVAADLNWRRLKYWRRLVAQALDPASQPGAVESITEVSLSHGPHAVVQAWLLASWMAQRLGWQVLTGRVQPGVEISWRFQAPQGDVRVRIKRLESGPPELRSVRIACKVDGKPGALNVVVEEAQRLAIRLEGVDAAPRTVNIPSLSPGEVVGRQLSDRERDPVFRESMQVAEVLAQSVLRASGG